MAVALDLWEAGDSRSRPAGAAVWEAVCALADSLTEVPRTIVGGQMVYLLGVEQGPSLIA